MKHILSLTLLFCVTLSTACFGQTEKMTREDKDEKNAARSTRIKDKNDIAVFRRQMVLLREYSEERRKILDVQKAKKMPAKVIITVDTTIDDETNKKTLTGYITKEIGDNSNNIYEVTFDRAKQKIITVKRIAEPEEAEKEEKAADDHAKQKGITAKHNADPEETDKEEKATDKKQPAGKTIHKKNKDEDDEDDDSDPDTEKSSKTKDKDDDKE